MEMVAKVINIFKIEYYWPEDEHEITYLGKDISQEEFEKDLIKAREFAESLIGNKVDGNYLGKGYSIECLPEFYKQIIWFLVEKLNYVECDIDDDVSYYVDDNSNNKKIGITRSEKQIKNSELN